MPNQEVKKMKKISKYILPDKDHVYLGMPAGAEILDAQVQNNKIVIWAFAETENLSEPEQRHFHLYETGTPVVEDREHLKYIRTLQQPDGYVIHVFEIV
jgi:hypothetical protein